MFTHTAIGGGLAVELITQIKENQKELHRETEEACRDLQPLSTYVSPIEKARNRIEQREAAVFNVKPYLIESHAWNKYIACPLCQGQ